MVTWGNKHPNSHGCDGDDATFLVHVVVVVVDDDDDDDDDYDDCFHSDTFWPTALENPDPKAFKRNMPAKKQRTHWYPNGNYIILQKITCFSRPSRLNGSPHQNLADYPFNFCPPLERYWKSTAGRHRPVAQQWRRILGSVTSHIFRSTRGWDRSGKKGRWVEWKPQFENSVKFVPGFIWVAKATWLRQHGATICRTFPLYPNAGLVVFFGAVS